MGLSQAVFGLWDFDVSLVVISFSYKNQIACKNLDPNDDDCHGLGVPLFSAHFSIDSAMCTVEVEDEQEHGLRHVLLCRVILGKVEAVPGGSKQSQSSSDQYDTEVDHIFALTIWTAFINVHIHPIYILFSSIM
ncbi:hypothetical protein VNO78_10905 [Psophocarpus tetragonolobus]|uniref:Uncharacterized protein n=1 Tax=Psophocarpus tetragonolobus TaxID=3891 RepID=A0AAN9XMY7_PSOTE